MSKTAAMPPIGAQLQAAALGCTDADLRKLLQWAALHVAEQQEAISRLEAEFAEEEAERLRLEAAMHAVRQSLEHALCCAAYGTPAPAPEIGRDYAGHINLMAAHGDPDYLLGKKGLSVRHVDLRSPKPRPAPGKDRAAQ